MKRLFLVTGFIASTQIAFAQDSIGHEKAIACSACHGQMGISVSDNIPNLAGQKATYLTNQLNRVGSLVNSD